MHSGTLWFGKGTTEERIRGALDYYKGKYGRDPDLCLVHPSMIEGRREIFVGNLRVRAYRPVLPGHVWVGLEDDEERRLTDRECLDFHPRAAKLMRKRKPFIVIAQDEPYFKQAYDLIRYSENLKGNWTDEDEQIYQELTATP